MHKIALLPLDERPCNYLFPSRLFEQENIHIEVPPVLSQGKRPADRQTIESFLEHAFQSCDVLILSMDMFLYGGLIPSRIHHLTEDELVARLQWLVSLRKKHPQVEVYAFQCIMRCPDYSSSAEEPDYYGVFGKEIHDLGVGMHRESAGLESPFNLSSLKEQIGRVVLSDYLRRRDLNLKMNQRTLRLLAEGTIDHLVIPQDDSSVYGFSAMDKEVIRNDLDTLDLTQKVLTYPGADEVELTLISRYLNRINHKAPRLYVRYITEASQNLVPLYEGQPLSKTVDAHVNAAGCTFAVSPQDADAIITLTGPGEDMLEADEQNRKGFVDISVTDKEQLLSFIKEYSLQTAPIIIADNEYANGGDISLIDALNREGLLLKVGGYAGWNTNANTLGTAIAQAVNLVLYGPSKKQQDFLLQRYLEDVAYCGQIRGYLQTVTESRRLPILSDEDISDMESALLEHVQKKMLSFTKQHLSSIASISRIDHLAFPWHRLFEIDLTAEITK